MRTMMWIKGNVCFDHVPSLLNQDFKKTTLQTCEFQRRQQETGLTCSPWKQHIAGSWHQISWLWEWWMDNTGTIVAEFTQSRMQAVYWGRGRELSSSEQVINLLGDEIHETLNLWPAPLTAHFVVIVQAEAENSTFLCIRGQIHS